MIMRPLAGRVVAALTGSVMLGGLALPASAANTFNVQVNAATQATVTVSMSSGSNVICDPGSAVSGIVACTNTVSATGSIRTRAAGTGSLTVTAPGATVAGQNNGSIPVSALKMTCSDNGSSGTRGSATFAAAASASTTAVSCANWPGPDVFLYSVLLSYAIDASQVNADTYTLSSGWTVTAAAT